MNHYLAGEDDHFQTKLKHLDDKEAMADNLRRDAENQLYAHSLIPQSRGDVLALLENMDYVIDTCKKTLTQFDIEKPEIDESLQKDFLLLTEACKLCRDDSAFHGGFFPKYQQCEGSFAQGLSLRERG